MTGRCPVTIRGDHCAAWPALGGVTPWSPGGTAGRVHRRADHRRSGAVEHRAARRRWAPCCGAIGRVRPNTGWLPAVMLDDDGFVRVTSEPSLSGYPRRVRASRDCAVPPAQPRRRLCWPCNVWACLIWFAAQLWPAVCWDRFGVQPGWPGGRSSIRPTAASGSRRGRSTGSCSPGSSDAASTAESGTKVPTMRLPPAAVLADAVRGICARSPLGSDPRCRRQPADVGFVDVPQRGALTSIPTRGTPPTGRRHAVVIRPSAA